MQLPAEVIMSYENLLEEFENASVQANCGFVEKANPLAACFKPGAQGKTSFECLIHCKDWKWKASTTAGPMSKRVNILLHIREQIRWRDRALLSSVVQVNYFHVLNGRARLLQAVHYDYDPCQRDHALFHAQVTNDILDISTSDAKTLKIDFSMPRRSYAPRLRNSRIPTCDMTFSSLLVSLAADHLGGDFFHNFRRRARHFQDKMPLPLVRKLRRSLETGPQDIRSSHWFCHTLPD